jgi:hypothetical protein
MQAQMLAIAAIIELIKLSLGHTLIIDALPENGGMSVEIMPGSSGAPSLNLKSQYRTIPLLFMSKFKNQQTSLNNLLEIGNYLSCKVNYLMTGVQILTANVKTEAALVGKEGDYWIYSMIVEIKIYFRKD